MRPFSLQASLAAQQAKNSLSGSAQESFDSIIVDGYTLRTRYNKYGDDLSNPWLWINRFVGHNFAIRVANEDNAKLTPNKITIRAGAQFPSKAYIDNGTELFYVTTEEVTYVRISDDVEKSWEKQAKITFKADGKTIAELPYTKTKGIEGNVPEIPAKDGYRATWESYTLTGEDIVVNAKYTKKAYTPLPTSVSMVKVQHGDQNKATDNFLVMSLSAHDYPSDGDNLGTGNTTISSAAFLAKSNLLESILINDKPIAQSEGYANVWGNRGAFGYRTSMPDADVLKVTILAGCEFPSYATLMGEAPEVLRIFSNSCFSFSYSCTNFSCACACWLTFALKLS